MQWISHSLGREPFWRHLVKIWHNGSDIQGAQIFHIFGPRQSIPCAFLGSSDTNASYTFCEEMDILSRVLVEDAIVEGADGFKLIVIVLLWAIETLNKSKLEGQFISLEEIFSLTASSALLNSTACGNWNLVKSVLLLLLAQVTYNQVKELQVNHPLD